MADPIALVKENPLRPAEDYVALRKEGFKHIENNGSAHWNEYNNSDPGITMLEAVSYAITDLAYRTGFEMRDLLAPEHLSDDTWKNIFYTARQILHNSALTISDYRKVIIDIEGVRNAWIEPSKNYEVPLWINYNHHHSGGDTECGCTEGAATGCYGKLLLNPVTDEEVKGEAIENIRGEITETTNSISTLQEKLHALIEYSGEAPDDKEQRTIERLRKKIRQLEKHRTALERELLRLENWTFIPSKIVELEGLYNVMVEFEDDVDHKQQEDIRGKVVDKLLKNRNLCEDFLSVNPVEYEDFGIAGSIVLKEDADPDFVLASIYFVIYKYFSPSVPFYTIEQMLEKGYTIDEIFDGPPLSHGFIETKELEKTDLYRDIRLSDIINEVIEIKGIKAITYLRLPFLGFENDEGGGYFNRWINHLREERKIARIQPSLSTMMFCKEREFITFNLGSERDRRPERMLKLFHDMKSMERKYKLEGAVNDLPVPSGEYMELEDYYPVTYSLPMCYGVSDRAALPADATEKRKVQALQLKGYLMFFEQLLADYLVQLGHIKELFSFSHSVSRTYFTRVLTELDDLQKLVIDHQDRGEEHWEKIKEDFTNVLEYLVETPKVFNERRNKFLDHMLARFSEDISEYESISRWLTPYKVDERLIGDKIRVLENGEYYKISTNRARGFNYASPHFWDSGNVSGTERRAARLLGFKSVNRRALASECIVVEPAATDADPKKRSDGKKKNKEGRPLNVVKILDPETKEVLLTSVEVTEGCCTDELILEILTYADDRVYFHFQDDLKSYARKSAGNVGTFSYELWNSVEADNAIVLAYGAKYHSRKEREDAFKRLQEALNCINDNEGFHLIEHVLLRPKWDEVLDEANDPVDVRLFDVCLDACDLGKGINEGDTPRYRKKIRRIPARKCYDQMPWVLEYFHTDSPTVSLLFQEAFPNEDENVLLKFRTYELLVNRMRAIHTYGTQRLNFEIVSAFLADTNEVKYSFILHGLEGEVLAQSAFIFNKRSAEQIENGTEIENDIDKAIEELMQYFGFELDLYCDPDPCDNSEDPYSFRATAVFPCWPKRFRDRTFRALVEKTIETQAPAHVHIQVKWISVQDMHSFECVFFNWLKEMSQTEIPGYEYVNPLVDILDTMQQCGCCEDDC